MSKSKGVVLGAGHVNNIGPGGEGGREGYGASGGPPGYKGTANPNFAEPGIRTGPEGRGTAANHVQGNPDEASTVRLQHPYGLVISENGQDHNNARANGDGTILDHMSKDYENPSPAPTVDSPVPGVAPMFDTGSIIDENRAHLGKG